MFTEYLSGQIPNLPNLALVREESLVSNICQPNPVAKRDNETLLFSLCVCKPTPAERGDSRYGLSKANFAQTREDCENWLE